jgi:hypothetical protein
MDFGGDVDFSAPQQRLRSFGRRIASAVKEPNWMAAFITVLVFFVIALVLAIVFGIAYGQNAGACPGQKIISGAGIPYVPNGIIPKKKQEQ